MFYLIWCGFSVFFKNSSSSLSFIFLLIFLFYSLWGLFIICRVEKGSRVILLGAGGNDDVNRVGWGWKYLKLEPSWRWLDVEW